MFNFYLKKGAGHFLVSIIAILLITSCATTSKVTTSNKTLSDLPPVQHSEYTYDGLYDPIVFFDWEIVKSGMCENGHFHVVVMNPDKDADIPLVETMNISSGILDGGYRVVAYRYYHIIEKQWYIFGLNPDSHYQQIQPEIIDKSRGI